MNGYRRLQNVCTKQERRITPQRYDYRNSQCSPHATQHRSKHRKHDPYLFNGRNMTREEYNHKRKPNPQLESMLCSWNFCDICIDTRTKHRMPIPELRNDGITQPYFRYINPNLRSSHPFYRNKTKAS